MVFMYQLLQALDSQEVREKLQVTSTTSAMAELGKSLGGHVIELVDVLRQGLDSKLNDIEE